MGKKIAHATRKTSLLFTRNFVINKFAKWFMAQSLWIFRKFRFRLVILFAACGIWMGYIYVFEYVYAHWEKVGNSFGVLRKDGTTCFGLKCYYRKFFARMPPVADMTRRIWIFGKRGGSAWRKVDRFEWNWIDIFVQKEGCSFSH